MKIKSLPGRMEAGANYFFNSVRSSGGSAYWVGGCVRDLLRGKDFNDIDIVICGLDARTLHKIVHEQFENVKLVGESFGIYKCDGYDIAHARTDRQIGEKHTDIAVDIDPSITIEEDLLRRDFTINAIAIDTFTREIVDPYNGRRDIDFGIIRAVDESAFTDDPLRIVRAYKFKSRLGYRLSPNTAEMIQDHRYSIQYLPPERILHELKDVFEKGDPEQFVSDVGSLLHASGIDKKYPRIFEDFIYQLYGGQEATLKALLSLDSHTTKACVTLHLSLFESRYDMLPIIVDKYPQLLNSAYIHKTLKKLNKLCIDNKVPRNLKELKSIDGIDGDFYRSTVPDKFIGGRLKDTLTKRMKEIYEYKST